MKVEILPAGVAPPSRKTPAPFTPARGKTVQTIPQARKPLPVLANLKPNYVPPAVRAAMMKGQPPAMVNAVSIPGQPPMRGGQIGPGMRRSYHPGAIAQGGGLDGFGNLGGAWEDWCDSTYGGEGGDPNLVKKCKTWGLVPPWTVAGKAVRGLPINWAKAVVETAKVGFETAKTVLPSGGSPSPAAGGGGSTNTSAGGQTGSDQQFPWSPSGGGGAPAAGSGTTIAIVAAGVVAAGGIGYLLLRNRRSASPMGSFSRRVRKSRRNRK